eukprot:CAMPEP_0183747312 /NCGR_PEP_ID=MMETSP0737-20130205/67197_1 /TAXON_ID=385413 /ORGANISM="Thalassiosira miniscula, Strain CCMP1093" /LENGTH=414 /DNA_ID=CAMNT_0025983021 /DNA_START=155 /DNA_END=1399 /DNA_ORIENTATION=+
MDEAASKLMGLMRNQNFKAGAIWALLMQRIYHLFRTSTDRSNCFNEEVISNTIIGTGMILSCARQLSFASNSDMELLWAIPNFANFLLSVDLISDTMSKKKRQMVELSEKELSTYEFDPQIHTDSGLANLMVLFLMAGAVGRTPNSTPGLANYFYRKKGFASAACQRMVQLWTDPYTRASLLLKKNQMSSVRQEWMPLAIMNLIDQSPTDHPLYIAPGLSVNDAIKTVVEEAFVYSPLRLKEMISCILDSYAFEQEAWSNFGAVERSNCAILAVGKFLDFKTVKERGLDLNLGAELAAVLMGQCTRGGSQQGIVNDPSLRLKVIKLAAKNRTPTSDRVYPRRMVPADYFGLFYDKIVEEHMPQVQTFAEMVNNSEEEMEEIPQEILLEIAEFAAEPFSLEARNGLELQYCSNIW